VREESGLAVAFPRVAERRVEGSPALVDVEPGDRMIGAHGRGTGRVRRFVERQEDRDVRAWVFAEGVPLVGALPARRERIGRGMGRVFDVDDGLLNGGVLTEVGADE